MRIFFPARIIGFRAAFIFAAASVYSAPISPAALQGTVSEAVSGAPLPGAIVRIGEDSVITDASGVFI